MVPLTGTLELAAPLGTVIVKVAAPEPSRFAGEVGVTVQVPHEPKSIFTETGRFPDPGNDHFIVSVIGCPCTGGHAEKLHDTPLESPWQVVTGVGEGPAVTLGVGVGLL